MTYLTNTWAAILVTVTTNWTTIGTFTPSGSPVPSHDIQAGQVVTNTEALVEYQKRIRYLPISACPGPVIGERKVALPIPPPLPEGITNLFHVPPPTNYSRWR